MKLTFTLSLGLAVVSAPTVLASHDLSSDRLVHRHAALRPRQYDSSGGHYVSNGYGAAYEGGASSAVETTSAGEQSSAAVAQDSSWSANYSTSSAWHETSTATASEPASTWSASASASDWKYGSGSWGKDQGAYNDCVQQCKAKYAAAPTYAASASYTPPAAAAPSATSGYAAPPAAAANGTAPLVGGPGEVIVAPMKGDLRMVPFNMNVKKGGKVKFIWGAGPHTVTKSSLTSLCNATMDAPFKSGMQNASFEFEVPVDTEDTVPYYCSVAQHCAHGMFGLINGIVSTEPAKGYGKWMETYAKNDTQSASMWAETQKLANGTDAENWGAMLDTSSMPEWAHPYAAESIMMTRQYYAANPKLLAAQTAAFDQSSSNLNSTSSATDSASPSSMSSTSDPSPSSMGLTAGSSSSVVSGLGIALALALSSAVLI